MRIQHRDKLHQSSDHGFTIVELLVVIIVIGILAAITIVSYSGISQRAKITSLQTDLTNASNNIKIFQTTSATNDYPTTINCSIADSSTNKCVKSSNGNAYTYTPHNTTNPKTFSLSLANGSDVYRITDNTSPSGSWLAGVAATSMAGKYVYSVDMEAQYKTTNTAIVAPQGIVGLDSYSASYKALVSPQANPSVIFYEYPAQSLCMSIGGRLPYLYELASIYTNRVSYGDDFDITYMSASEGISNPDMEYVYGFAGAGGVFLSLKNQSLPVRCVADQ